MSDRDKLFGYLAIGLAGVALFAVIISAVYSGIHTYTETHQMIIAIEDMDKTVTTTYTYINKMPVPHYTNHYWIYFNDGEGKFEVSSKIYSNTSIGDKMVINVTDYYDDTNNQIYKTSYSYAGE